MEREVLPLSLLNDFLYCPRRAALKLLEGWRDENEHTVLGELAHEHANLPGYESAILDAKSQIILWRALPVWSHRLGISGKCDIVEAEFHSPPHLKSEIANLKSLTPVEFKLGKRKQWENDDVQLCAQALCLEEMFCIPIQHGAIYHAKSRRRRHVEVTPALRAQTEDAVVKLHALRVAGAVPAAQYNEAKCKGCSLFDICLPKLTSKPDSVTRASHQLFEI